MRTYAYNLAFVTTVYLFSKGYIGTSEKYLCPTRPKNSTKVCSNRNFLETYITKKGVVFR